MMNYQDCLGSFLFFSVFCIWFSSQHAICGNESTAVHVGVVLDMNTALGPEAYVSMSLAILDFYKKHPYYQTKLVLDTRDANDVVGAACAVLDLIKNVQVQAIIGPQTTEQVTFAIELGKKAHVPIISFSATSPFLSPDQSPYFIRAGQNDSSQVKAITALMQGYNWHEIVIINEDTEFGNGIIPHLTDAFQEVGVQVPYKKAIPLQANTNQIKRELKKIRKMPTRVILLHTDVLLGSRILKHADEEEMMNEGYAWILTDGLSNSINDLDPSVVESMEGALGLRPYIPRSEELESFKFRWKRLFPLMRPNDSVTDLNIFGLWAYDTIWALAMAVERIGQIKNRFINEKDVKCGTDLENLGISEIGPRLLDEMLNTKLKGLSGEFQLVNGNLQPAAFEILNVVGKGERIIGYWTPDKGVSRTLSGSRTNLQYSTNTSVLKKIIWPGDSAEKPLGRDKPVSKNKLRVGIPVKTGFTEFVKMFRDNDTSEIHFDGFSIDIFRAALAKLPSGPLYEFIPFPTDHKETTKSYNKLLYAVYDKTFDAVVGDTTIVSSRWYVDFTLPYSDSGVSMVVPKRLEWSKNIWIFIKPFSWDLWLTILAASIVTGCAVYILECHHADQTQQSAPTKSIETILWLPLSSLYYAERDMVTSNRSRIVLVVWYFLMLILIQSYTASLTSILTMQSLTPKIVDLTQDHVGYQEGSFVKDLLINKLKFQESKLKSYGTVEEYDQALSKGSNNGGVAAIFDETPYISLFLAKYCSKYMIAGPTYKTDGFGFAFPVDSPLVSLVSKAILNVTQGIEMEEIERKYFYGIACEQDQAAIASKSYGLKAYSFAGLLIVSFGGILIIVATVTLLQVVLNSSKWKKRVSTANNSTQLQSLVGNNSGYNQSTNESVNVSGDASMNQSPSMTSSHSGKDVTAEIEEEREEI